MKGGSSAGVWRRPHEGSMVDDCWEDARAVEAEGRNGHGFFVWRFKQADCNKGSFDYNSRTRIYKREVSSRIWYERQYT